jgi:NAD kinase
MKKNFASNTLANVLIEKIQALNDIVLDRGSAQALTNIEFSINGKYVTNILADG